MSNETIYRLQNVAKMYGERRVLDIDDLDIPGGNVGRGRAQRCR